MKHWKIVFRDGSRFEVYGTFKDAMKICYERDEIPAFVVGKPLCK